LFFSILEFFSKKITFQQTAFQFLTKATEIPGLKGSNVLKMDLIIHSAVE